MSLHLVEVTLLCLLLIGFVQEKSVIAKAIRRTHHRRHEEDVPQALKPMSFNERMVEQSVHEWSSVNDETDGATDHRDGKFVVRRKRQDSKYEVEFTKLANTSSCAYYIDSVRDTSGNWISENFKHIKCRSKGQHCPGSSKSLPTHCCYQTYRNVNVTFGENIMEEIFLFTGCVCAYMRYGYTMDDGEIEINH